LWLCNGFYNGWEVVIDDDMVKFFPFEVWAVVAIISFLSVLASFILMVSTIQGYQHRLH
jgi:hypothetical protein